MQYFWLAFALLIAVIGVAVGRVLSFSPPATVTLTSVPAFLALFPFMRRWMPKARFGYWVTAAAISTAVAWLLYLGLSRIGG